MGGLYGIKTLLYDYKTQELYSPVFVKKWEKYKINKASCQGEKYISHGPSPSENCKCGLYASFSEIGTFSTLGLETEINLSFVVSGSGKIIRGVRGFRSEYMMLKCQIEMLYYSDYKVSNFPIIQLKDVPNFISEQNSRVSVVG